MMRLLSLLIFILPIVSNGQTVLDAAYAGQVDTIQLTPTENTANYNGHSVFLFESVNVDTLDVPSNDFWNSLHYLIPDSAISGVYLLYFPYGNKKKVALSVEYENNTLNGYTFEYYYSGQKKSQILFSNGKKNGPDFRYNKYGQLLQFETYKNGILNGLFMSFFYSGHPSCSGSYLNGKLHGEYKCWGQNLDHNYEIISTVNYDNGIRNN